MTAPVPPRSWLAVSPALAVLAWAGNHFTPLLPLYRDLGGYSAVQTDLVLAAYVAGIVPGFLAAVRIPARYGLRCPLVVALVLSIAGSTLLAAGAESVTALCIGRLLCGLASGVGMVVGSGWLGQLSRDRTSAARTARRVGLSLTVGFLLGPVVSGSLAQWAPWPTGLPFVVHGTLTVVALASLAVAPTPAAAAGRAGEPPLPPLPATARRRMLVLVVPAAPWTSAAPALAGAVAPALLAGLVVGHEVTLATLLVVTVLGSGALAQAVFPRVQPWARGRHGALGLGLMTIGALLLLPAVEASLRVALALAFCSAALLGLGQGLGLVGGLADVQEIADPHRLPSLTATFYALSYVGFTLPFVVSVLDLWVPTEATLLGVAVLAALAGLHLFLAPGRAGRSTCAIEVESARV